jgi:alpha-ribazole phosphatase
MQHLILTVWRHPKPHHVAGRCIGQTNVPVDHRRAKRLAHQIRAHARTNGAPKIVVTSPLQRCAQVGRWLARWGWQHQIEPLLIEINFGEWDGKMWHQIEKITIDNWCANFADHHPGGGESVVDLMARCQRFIEQHGAYAHHVVGHAGWINAAIWLTQNPPEFLPTAAQWPAPLPYSRSVGFNLG